MATNIYWFQYKSIGDFYQSSDAADIHRFKIKTLCWRKWYTPAADLERNQHRGTPPKKLRPLKGLPEPISWESPNL